MTALEIILLLIGIICVAASFIFFMKVDGEESVSTVNMTFSEKQKDDIKRQIAAAYQEQMDEMTYKVRENTETALEKLSNRKIQELSEYSDTILADINKNHNEVMFLYDMLNEKSKEVHNNIRDINIAIERINEAEEKAEKQIEAYRKETEKKTSKSTSVRKSVKSRTSENGVNADGMSRVETQEQLQEGNLVENAASDENESKKPAGRKNSAGRRKSSKTAGSTSEKTDADKMNTETNSTTEGTSAKDLSDTNAEIMMGMGKKEAVLSLYNEGKNNVEIAKALGLGVGEVKLVIDLFKGQK